jgi:hypothetical protein
MHSINKTSFQTLSKMELVNLVRIHVNMGVITLSLNINPPPNPSVYCINKLRNKIYKSPSTNLVTENPHISFNG